MEAFEQALSGGHPNSLGNTVEVVETVLAHPGRMEELFLCYQSTDETVRLRTSNAMKRIAKAQRELLLPYLDRLLTEVAPIDQASAQWTLSQLFGTYAKDFTDSQKKAAQAHMQRNLAEHQDWIVLNATMDTLGQWAKKDATLRAWLLPHLERLSQDERKSVAGRAKKVMGKLMG